MFEFCVEERVVFVCGECTAVGKAAEKEKRVVERIQWQQCCVL